MFISIFGAVGKTGYLLDILEELDNKYRIYMYNGQESLIRYNRKVKHRSYSTDMQKMVEENSRLRNVKYFNFDNLDFLSSIKKTDIIVMNRLDEIYPEGTHSRADHYKMMDLLEKCIENVVIYTAQTKNRIDSLISFYLTERISVNLSDRTIMFIHHLDRRNHHFELAKIILTRNGEKK